MANRTYDLTPKQLHFCRCVASGKTQAAAYREAFDCRAGSLNKTQQESASKLMSKPKVAARVETLVRQIDRAVIASSVSDSDRVLTKLRDLLENAEGTSAEHVMLKAAGLLGQTQGMYKRVSESTRTVRTEAEVLADIEARLAEFEAGGAVH